MNKKRLLKEIQTCNEKINEELIGNSVQGCLILIREGKPTEIQTY